ncbi:MAG: hypothetical protein KY446_12285 [Proteobacteria bacterium]|nr:hypothetical protein [Pseudomonadota bacterium]
MAAQGLATALRVPEPNVFGFAVLLNFPWEFLQTPLFEGMADAPHWRAVQRCGIATIGDGVIMLVAFWCMAAVARTRGWVLKPSFRQTLGFTVVGAGVTVAVERLATIGLWPMSWSYADAMPIVPVLGAGLSPLLQWLILPPLVVWLVRRQLT